MTRIVVRPVGPATFRGPAGRVAVLSVLVALLLIPACTVENVTDVTISSVSVFPNPVNAVEGELIELTATVRGELGDPLPGAVPVWSSDDPSIASVDADGVVTAHMEGSVTIRATYRGAEGTTLVRVLAGPRIALSTDTIDLFAGAGGSTPEPQQVFVTNGGTGTLSDLTVDVRHPSGEPEWLRATLGRITAPTAVTLSADTDGLSVGTYSATLTVGTTTPGVVSREVAVTLTLTGFSVNETNGSTSVSESGTVDSLAVSLDSQPASNVVLTVSSSDPSEAAVSPPRLTFTPDNWDVAQTVTVLGVDDSDADEDQVSQVTVAVDRAASDDTFDDFLPYVVSVTTVDDENADIAVVESVGSTVVTEAGSTDDLSVTLTAPPQTRVVLNVSSADIGEVTVSPISLTFTPTNWNLAQVVTVTGIDDLADDGDQDTNVVFAVDDSRSDAPFHATPDRVVVVTTEDDDEPAGLTVVESGGSTAVGETGSTDGFTVALSTEPASNVVVAVTSADASEVTVAPATLTFTPANWSTPQSVTVTGVDDDVADGDQSTAVTLSIVDDSSDDTFDGVENRIVTVPTADDDMTGLALVQSGGSTSVSETGTTDSFTLALSSLPSASVTLIVSSSDDGEATVSPTSLTFTTENWATPRTVTVTGVDDLVADGEQSSTITVRVDPGTADLIYRAVPPRTFPATTTDNDVAGLSMEQTGGTTLVTEAGSTDAVEVSLTAQPLTPVVIDVTSADLTEMTSSPTTLSFTADDWDEPQTVTVTGVDDYDDDGNLTTNLQLVVRNADSDAAFAGVSGTVGVVTEDDDAAPNIILGGASPGSAVSETGTSIQITVRLASATLTPVVLSVSSGDPSEAIASPTTLTFDETNWDTPVVVTITGQPDDEDDGTQNSVITIAVIDEQSDTNYQAVTPQTFPVVTTDVPGG